MKTEVEQLIDNTPDFPSLWIDEDGDIWLWYDRRTAAIIHAEEDKDNLSVIAGAVFEDAEKFHHLKPFIGKLTLSN